MLPFKIPGKSNLIRYSFHSFYPLKDDSISFSRHIETFKAFDPKTRKANQKHEFTQATKTLKASYSISIKRFFYIKPFIFSLICKKKKKDLIDGNNFRQFS
jgi:hypothetical protein